MKKLFFSFFLLAIANNLLCSELETVVSSKNENSRKKAKSMLIGKLFVYKSSAQLVKNDEKIFENKIEELADENNIIIKSVIVQSPVFYRALLISTSDEAYSLNNIKDIKKKLENKLKQKDNQQLNDLVIVTNLMDQ